MTWRRWSSAWKRALYGPDGFYRTQSPADHFATSVWGVPGTADVLADALVEFMKRQRLSTFVDLGAGNGALTAAMAAHPHVSAVGIELRPHRPPPEEADNGRYRWDRVEWVELPPLSFATLRLRRELRPIRNALVFAHEWLDTVPCEIAELAPDGRLRYVLYDDASGTERLGAAIHGADLAWCGGHWQPEQLAIGERIEIGRTRDLRWQGVIACLGSGVVIAVDYGHTRRNRPAGGSLNGYRDGRAVPPVPDGSCDLTAHVAMDSLGAQVLVDQRTALRELGVGATPPAPASAGKDPAGYLRALARSAAGAALVGPGYGDALWAIARAGTTPAR